MLELICIRGIGVRDSNPQPPGVDPTVTMSYSIDQGNTYNTLTPRSMGTQGDFQARQIWHQIGRTNGSIIFKFTTSDPVPVDFVGLYLQVGVK